MKGLLFAENTIFSFKNNINLKNQVKKLKRGMMMEKEVLWS